MSIPAFSPLWLAALPGVLAVWLWAVTNLQRFVLYAVTAAMIVPIALARPGGTQVALADVLLLVAIAAWLVAASIRAVPGPWLSGNRMLLPALVFVAVNAESLIWSVRPRDTLVFTIQLVEIIVVFPVVFASLPRSVKDIRRGLLIFVACTCALAVYTAIVYGPRAASGSLEGQNLSGGLNKNVIGSFVAGGLIMAYTLWLGERRRFLKRLLALATLIELAGLISTVSRASLIGTFVAVLAASLLLRRDRIPTVAVTTLIVIAYLSILGTSSQVDLSVAGSYDSSVVRSFSYANAVEKIRERPLVGTGGGTYTDYISELQLSLPDPNNMFLLTWAELGLGGMLALIFLLIRYARLLAAVRSLPDECAVPAVAAGCVTLSLFIHFQFDVTWTRGTSSLAFAMMGLMLAATRLAPEDSEKVSPPANLEPQPAPLRRTPSLAA